MCTNSLEKSFFYPSSRVNGGGAGTKARDAVSGIGVPFVDGQRRPILSLQTGFKQAGWVDIIPSDESFYIGCSFETH